jgi:2'-5' RNA ligase
MPAALRRSRPPLPRFAVAWLPKFEGLERIEAFRRTHDPASPLIAAHLSLVFPFPTAHSRLQVETHVRHVVSRWPPIPVTFGRVRRHANEFLFLMASRGAASVTALHDKLYTRTLQPHLRRDLPYEPHITLARYASLDQLDAAFSQAEEEFREEFAQVMREVQLLSVGRDGKIEFLKSIPLDSA